MPVNINNRGETSERVDQFFCIGWLVSSDGNRFYDREVDESYKHLENEEHMEKQRITKKTKAQNDEHGENKMWKESVKQKWFG